MGLRLGLRAVVEAVVGPAGGENGRLIVVWIGHEGRGNCIGKPSQRRRKVAVCGASGGRWWWWCWSGRRPGTRCAKRGQCALLPPAAAARLVGVARRRLPHQSRAGRARTARLGPGAARRAALRLVIICRRPTCDSLRARLRHGQLQTQTHAPPRCRRPDLSTRGHVTAGGRPPRALHLRGAGSTP